LELNKIYNEDCLDTMRRMEDNFIDLTVTSPPYDNLRTYNGYVFGFEGIAKELYRVTKEGGIVIWIVGDETIKGSETGTSFKQALYFKECGFNLHDTMIYQKDSIAFPETNRYSQIFEYMFILSKGKPKTFNCIKDRPNKWYNGKKKIKGNYRNVDGELSRHNKENLLEPFGSRYNIWEVSCGKNKSSTDEVAFKHPAIFPEKLVKDHILSWSNEGELIYDPFGGSGTVAKMAHLLNRKWILSEISDKYVEIAENRIKPYTSNPILF
jgi:DNA modification methylase